MADLLSVVIGGLLAVGGGGATQWILNKSKQEDEKKRQSATKFEELVNVVYELDHWLKMVGNRNAFGTQDSETPTPFAKAHAIALIYFPQFLERVKALEMEADKYVLWSLGAGKKRLAGDVESILTGNLDSYKPYLKARLVLIEELRVYGQREFSGIPSAE